LRWIDKSSALMSDRQTYERYACIRELPPSLYLRRRSLPWHEKSKGKFANVAPAASQPASNREFVTYIHINVCKGMWCLAGQNVLEIEGAFSSGSWWPVIILSAASLPSTLAPDMIVKSSLPRVCTRATEISHSQTSQEQNLPKIA
jgi:hypothetical protein